MKKRITCHKLIVMLLCLLLMSMLISACSSGKEALPSENRSDTTNQTKTAESKEDDKTGDGLIYNGSAPITEEKKTFTILTTNSGSKELGYKDMVWRQELEKKANIELEIEEIDNSSYNDVVRPRLAAGVDLPDAVRLPTQDEDMAYINSGIFIELTPYYEKYGYNLAHHFERHEGLKGQITTPDGKIYYLPYLHTTYDNSRCLMLNRDYLDRIGMSAENIKTLDDYYEYLVAVKNNDANGNGDPSDEIPLFMRAGMTQLWGMYWGLDLSDGGGYQVEKDGTVICGYADDRYREMLTFFNKLYTEGLLYNEFATADLDTQNALFANNRIGSIMHFISNTTGYSLQINPDWDFDNDEPIIFPLVPPLTGPYGDQWVYGRNPLASFYGITTYCEDPETLFCFFDYLYSEEAGIMAWYGIEGVDYNIVDGEYVFSEEYLTNKDNYRTKCGYNFEGLPGYQYPGGYMATQCKAVREASSVLNNYLMNPTNTFSFKFEDEIDTIQAYAADLRTYFEENFIAFITGTRPLTDDEWNSYISTLESMNLSNVIEVYQATADRKKEATAK